MKKQLKNIRKFKGKELWVILIILLLVSAGLFWKFTQNQSSSDTSSQHSKTSIKTDVFSEADTANLIQKQSNLVPKELGIQKLHDYLAILGVLDPYADKKNEFGLDPEGRAVGKLHNILAGYYEAKLGSTGSEIHAYIEQFLEGAMQFEEKKYFGDMKDKLEQLRKVFEGNSKLEIVALWPSGIGRINDIFSDGETAFMFPADGLWYDFSHKVSSEDVEGSKKLNDIIMQFGHTKEQKAAIHESLLFMKQLDADTVYRCDNKLFVILKSYINNAFGFVYGAQSKESLHCGLLRGRFDVLKFSELSDGWSFFVVR